MDSDLSLVRVLLLKYCLNFFFSLADPYVLLSCHEFLPLTISAHSLFLFFVVFLNISSLFIYLDMLRLNPEP